VGALRGFWAGTFVIVATMGAWAMWAFGVPFADRDCHRSQSQQLDRLEATVRDLVPVATTDRRDQCRDDADPLVIARTSADLGLPDVISRLTRAGWQPNGEESSYQSPNGRMYVHVFSSAGPSNGPTVVEIQRVGYRQPADD